MTPENEKSILNLLLERNNQCRVIEETQLQKIELISKHLSDLQAELAKLDSPDKYCGMDFRS
jgi:hypothetical protein